MMDGWMFEKVLYYASCNKIEVQGFHVLPYRETLFALEQEAGLQVMDKFILRELMETVMQWACILL